MLSDITDLKNRPVYVAPLPEPQKRDTVKFEKPSDTSPIVKLQKAMKVKLDRQLENEEPVFLKQMATKNVS
jgi:hypothetical protein